MSFTALKRKRVVVVARGKGRPDGGTTGIDGIAVEESVDAILVKVFIHPDVVLLGVIEAAGVEVALIKDRGTAWNVVSAGGAAAGIGEAAVGVPKACAAVLCTLRRVALLGVYLFRSVNSGLFGWTLFAKVTNAGSS